MLIERLTNVMQMCNINGTDSPKSIARLAYIPQKAAEHEELEC